MKNICFNLLILAVLIVSGSHSVRGQSDYSKPFKDGVDSWNKYCPETYQNLCKTTFIEETVVNLLDSPGIDHVRVGYIEVFGQGYFTMSAMKNATEIINTIIGSYPCPEDCVPPGILLDSMGSVFTKIDIEDINEILDYRTNVAYITVRLGGKFEDSDSHAPAIIIYGAKGSYRPNVPSSVTDYDKPGHPRFISSQ